MITSQKILGLKQLQKAGSGYGTDYVNILPITATITAALTGSLASLASKLPAFCRPCPVNPRHGFVESRLIKTVEELEALRAETFKAEPEASIMLTPLIEADYNAIWTPSSLTLGPGHDGATSGKGAITIPLAGKRGAPLDDEFLNEARIDPEKQSPYVEVVGKGLLGNLLYVTQLRAGPPIDPASPDYIPQAMRVQRVIKTAGEDLLEWETKVRAMTDGDVVWHPSGSIADHYSVHCRVSGVPICLSFEPKVGEVIEAKPAPPPDVASLLKGALVGDTIDLSSDAGRSGLAFLLLALHNGAVLNGPSSFWLGAAITVMLRLGSCALRGESRHEPTAYEVCQGSKKRVLGGLPQTWTSRQGVWQHYWNKPLSSHRAGLSRLEVVFRWGRWGGPNGNGTDVGAGGVKWAQCADAMRPLFNALREAMIEASPTAAKDLLLAFNLAVNQVHNNGWWLNKFGPASWLNSIQKGDLFPSLNAIPAIWALKIASESLSQEALLKKRKQWAAWPVTVIRPPVPREVEVKESYGRLSINVKTRMGSTSRQIGMGRLDQIFVVPHPTNGGFMVVERNHDGAPDQILYEDVPLDLSAKVHRPRW